MTGSVDCLFCGDPCNVSRNGAFCADCGVYADRRWPSLRWIIYLPSWMIPCSEADE